MSKENSSNNIQVLKLLNQTVSEPHFLFHFLTFFSYLVLRCSASQVLAPNLTQNLLRRVTLSLSLFNLYHRSLIYSFSYECEFFIFQEIQTLLAFAVLAFIKVHVVLI